MCYVYHDSVAYITMYVYNYELMYIVFIMMVNVYVYYMFTTFIYFISAGSIHMKSSPSNDFL